MLANLFKPVKVGKLKLNNRIALSPMGIGSYNEDETITEEYVDFINSRSRNTGLIITTGTRVTDRYGKYRINGCYSRRFIPGLSKLVKAAQKNGSKIFLQILALGPADPLEPLVPWLGAYKKDVIEDMQIKPRELTLEQIWEIVGFFIESAKIAQEAGFDGVELFGSEDGLISSFICPHFNKRDDIFGGSFDNRLRFPLEIIKGIKKECGSSFPVGFKFNAYYGIEEGIDLELGIRIAEKISFEGADYIHCWSFETFEKPMSTYKFSPMPGSYQPRNSLTGISGDLKKRLDSVPVMVAGGILKPDEADGIIENGLADIVAVGRAFIAENLWAFKSRYSQQVRPCIRCHICHNEVAVKGNLISCSVNPDVLGRDTIIKAKNPARIAVVGAGPAGIMAAVVASRRGHHVKIFEKNSRVGGKLVYGSIPEFKYEFKDFLNYLENELYESYVEICTETEAAAKDFSEKHFDAVIIAAGARQYYPVIQGVEGSNVFEAVFALGNPSHFEGRSICVIGGGEVGCETALFLKRHGGNKVIIVEMLDELMKEEIRHNSIILEKMIFDEGIQVCTGSRVVKITPQDVTVAAAEYKVNYQERNSESSSKFSMAKTYTTDFVILATGYRKPLDLLESFKKLAIKKYIIGDCAQPGRLKEAIRSGYDAGMSV